MILDQMIFLQIQFFRLGHYAELPFLINNLLEFHQVILSQPNLVVLSKSASLLDSALSMQQ